MSWHTHRLQKAGIVSEAWRQVGGTGEDRVSGSDRQLSIKSGWADNAVRVRVLIKMSPAQTVTRGWRHSGGGSPLSQKCKCSLSNMDFSLENLKFYAALRSKQRDWFSIASWLVGDSLQFRKNREEEQEACGKWNMFWQLWPECLTGGEGLGTTGREGWIKTGWPEMTLMCVSYYCLPPCFWIVFPQMSVPYSPLTESFLRLSRVSAASLIAGEDGNWNAFGQRTTDLAAGI